MKQIQIMKCSAFLFLLIPCLAFAGNKGEVAEKKINRVFSIESNGRVSIDNKYGDIDIAIGESRSVRFDITVTVKAGSLKKAQEGLDRISVEFSEGLNRVDAETVIESSSSWMSWFSSGNVEMEIDYQVLVPADVYLDLLNRYGSIYLEKTDRDIRIDIGYGDIRLGDINAKLELDMAYSDGSISQIRNGELNLSYSDLQMENSDVLEVNMKYTDLVMGSAIRLNLVSAYGDCKGMDVDEITYEGKYDDVAFDRVKSIDAEAGYTGIHLSGLDQKGQFDMRYGDLSIDHIGPGFSSLNINTSYTGVVLGFSSGTSFSVDAETEYCDIHHSDLKVTEEIERSSSRIFKGSRGAGGGKIVARMNYGELSMD